MKYSILAIDVCGGSRLSAGSTVPFIYPGQGSDVGDSNPDSGSSGGKGQLRALRKVHQETRTKVSGHWVKKSSH